MSNASLEAVLVVATSLVVGLFAGSVHCEELRVCSAAGTCASASTWGDEWYTCSFTNHVNVVSDKLYGSDERGDATFSAALTREVCAPGEKLHRNSVTSAIECAPWRTWPDAFDPKIADADATLEHDQACGAWIQAGPAVQPSVEYHAFYDGSRGVAAVQHADQYAYRSTRLSGTDMGKFYTACSATILSGAAAVRSSAKEAYAHLQTGLGGLTTQRRVLEAVGWLSSHSCDSPVQIGVSVGGSNFIATSQEGSAFTASALASALYAVDEPRGLQDAASAGNALVNAATASSPPTTLESMEFVYEGGSARTDHDTVPIQMAATPTLDGLVYITSTGQGRFEEASAYVHGVAALCAFALHGAMDVESAGGYTAALSEVHALRAKKPRAAALGRLRGGHFGHAMSEVSNETLAQASGVTFSQLEAAPKGNAHTDCAAMTNFLFPDRMDEQHFHMLVTDKLYARAEEITAVLRESAAQVVVDNPSIAAVLTDPAAVAADIRTTTVRIAGAPKGTWAGLQRGHADGVLSSADGPLLMALKQARALFIDRVNSLFDGSGLCAAPAVYDALTTNAYIQPSSLCSHVLLGILQKPFADERYDNTSLATRFGYVMAHELAHTTLNTQFNQPQYANLLHRYSSSAVHDEAISDVIAALAILHAGLATGEQVCGHVSQLWCARVPVWYDHYATEAAHPGPNDRGDHLCATLKDLGVL